MHHHVIWSQGFIEHRTKGYVNTFDDAMAIAQSLMRNGFAVWANPDYPCQDTNCSPFMQSEISDVLDRKE